VDCEAVPAGRARTDCYMVFVARIGDNWTSLLGISESHSHADALICSMFSMWTPPRLYEIIPAFCNSLATSVTLVRRTPIIWARNSWVSGRSTPARSCIRRSHMQVGATDLPSCPYASAHRTAALAPIISKRRKVRSPILDVSPSFCLPPVEPLQWREP
jgi:hypothetical protein